jgi:hypothetical protein
MNRIKRFWPRVLLGGLLLVTSMGATSASPNDAPLTSTAKTLTVSASDCYPWADDADYFNGGAYIQGKSGTPSFICPVHLPEYGTWKVQSITMYVRDNASAYNICAEAARTNPSAGGETIMGEVCSSGATSAHVRSFGISGGQINPNTVEPTHGMYFWVTMKGTDKLRLYGFHISYAPDVSIDIEKYTNGIDADQAPGALILEGDPVTWTYEVENTGSDALSSVAVTDDQGGVTVTCPTDMLAPGESMTCTAYGTAVAGQYGNIGTVVGTPSEGPNVSDQDASHYFGADEILPTYLPLAMRNY